MYKSQISQLFFASCFGPLGLLYSSLTAALLLTVATLLAALLFLPHIAYVVTGSLILSVFIGDRLVCTYNRRRQSLLYNPGAYIGGVRCRLTGHKVANEPGYAAALKRVRWHRRIVAVSKYGLSPLALLVCIWLTQPEPLRNALVVALQAPLSAAASVESEPPFEAALRVDSALPDSLPSESASYWQALPGAAGEVAFTLKSRNFINTTDGWVRPLLKLSCASNRTRMQIQTHEVLGTEYARVSFALAADKLAAASWTLHSDYRTLQVSQPVSLVRRFVGSNNLQVIYQPFDSDTRRYATFDLSDSQRVVASVRRACNW